ncbi:2'-5' RNA ligase family protein [Thermaurantiacus sp.]
MAESVAPTSGTLILTLGLDRRTQGTLDALRRAAWPAGRPGIPAHLTLLRHLPGPQAQVICSELRMEARGRQPFAVRFLPLRARGDALFLPARSETLCDLHAGLVHRLAPLLRPQDRAPPDLHVTLAAGLPPGAAMRLAATLGRADVPARGRAEALQVWRMGPPWSLPWSLLVSLRLGQ